MHQYLKIPYEKIKIIPLGVDHDFFKPSIDKDLTRKQVLSKLKIPPEKYFFHVSEMNFARKNQIRLAEAYQMARESGLKHNLIIAGKYLPEIKKKIGHLPGIFFLDWVTHEQLLQLYQGADAFVLPSIHEGFGIPLVESMCCGVPCISTNKHSPPHLIQDAGILINPRDVSEISDSMLNIVKDPKLLKQLSEKSLKRSEYFSWKKYAKQVFELYDIDCAKKMVDFDTQYELAAYRTLVTVCDTFPDKEHPLLFSLLKLDYTKKMVDFDTQYELAAYRTLVTVCDIFPDKEHPLLFSLLKLDYQKLLEWAADYGLHDSKTKDFLIPFENWIYKKLGRPMVCET